MFFKLFNIIFDLSLSILNLNDIKILGRLIHHELRYRFLEIRKDYCVLFDFLDIQSLNFILRFELSFGILSLKILSTRFPSLGLFSALTFRFRVLITIVLTFLN